MTSVVLGWISGSRHPHYYWEPCSSTHMRERNSKQLTYHQWCTPHTNRALIMRSPYTLPKHIMLFLDLPHDVIRSAA